LRRKLITELDPEERADLEASIAALEATMPRTHQQTFTDHVQVGVAVAGNVHGNVYLNGYRSDDQARILASYLQRLVADCDQLPLHALTDTKSAGVQGGVTLQTVYTQLVTTTLVPREDLRDDVLRSFDFNTFLAKATDPQRLPADRRTAVRAEQRTSDGHYLPLEGVEPHWRGDVTAPSVGIALDATMHPQISELAKRADRLIFSGPELVTEAVARSQHLVLLGEPGSGKSTALRFLALSLAQVVQQIAVDPAATLEGWSAGRLIPIYAPLLPFAHLLDQRGARRATDTDLWNYLATRLNGVRLPQEPAQHPGTADAIAHELHAGRVLLLLDGLDEVVGDESRQAVTEAVLAFAQAHRDCRMVVACRIRAYEGPRNQAWQLPGWPTATLANWTQAQMDTFVTAWYRAAASIHGLTALQQQTRATALRTALARRPDLRRLGERPLLLTIMALVHLSRDLPEDRASLYRVCIEKLLVEWERRGKEESDYGALTDYIGLEGRDIGALLPMLRKAAFIAHEAAERGALGRIGSDRLRILVMDELAVLGHPNPHAAAKRFLQYTDHRAGLIQASDASDAYAFPHQTFQEYLAGVELGAQESFTQAVMARRHDDRWETPIQLALGNLMASTSYQMIADLFDELVHQEGRTDEQCQHDVILAATLVMDLGRKRLDSSNDRLRRQCGQIAQALARVVEGTVLPAKERMRVGILLGELGDPRPGVVTLPPMMVAFAGGRFVLGDNTNGHINTVAPFELARYLVTNAQWAIFMAADGYNPMQPWWDAAGRAWLKPRTHTAPNNWQDDRFGSARPNHPVVSISWYEATAFCRWLTEYLKDGFSYCLPSELEWEYACRGNERRTYAWGNQEPDDERANFNNRYKGTSAVGCFPTGATPATGLLDMTGTVWEWTRSEYRSYPYNADDGREDGTEPAQKRFTLRGGGWYSLPINLRASSRVDSPDDRTFNVGLRLARHSPV